MICSSENLFFIFTPPDSIIILSGLIYGMVQIFGRKSAFEGGFNNE